MSGSREGRRRNGAAAGGSGAQVRAHRATLEQFDFLWAREAGAEFQQFLRARAGRPDDVLRGIEEALRKLKETEGRIKVAATAEQHRY